MREVSIISKIAKTVKKLIEGGYVIDIPESAEGIDGHIVSYVDKESRLAEQYKVLRTDFYFLSPEKPLKTVVITSSQPEEGKTITACNLAVSITLDANKKVVLIDGDLKRASVHRIFNIKRKPGFVDLLEGTVDPEYFFKEPVIENLYVIPAGTLSENPSEKLNTEKIYTVLDKFKKNCDYLIFDSPPVLDATDASILGTLCDGVLLVVKANVTPKKSIKEAMEHLNNAHVKPKGCILTNVKARLAYDYYYHKEA